MKSIFNDPEFQSIIKEGKSRHEINIIVGNAIRKYYPKPLETFIGCPRENIIDALVATCSTEEEINKVLEDAGLGGNFLISIMESPTTDEEKEGIAICMALGATITKDGLPCMIMDMSI